MNFGLTKRQQNLKNSVRKFCATEFDLELALKLDKNEKFPINLYRKSSKKGFPSLFIPKKYGGKGQGHLAYCIAMEEMCRADSSLGLACMIGTFGSEILILQGTEEQKNFYLQPVCRGDSISAVAFTEPSHGTDISTVDTTAVKHGKEWLINGTKTLITNAPIADFFFVLCDTASKQNSQQSQSIFIVNRQTKGLKIKKISNKLGIRCVTTGKVTFKEVKVKENSLIGKQNNGFFDALNFFTISRTVIAAQAVGTALGSLEIAIKYAKKRKSAGQAIISYQQIGAKLAQVASEIEAARLLTYNAAWTIDNNVANPMLTSMAKLNASKVAVKATNIAIQTLGGYGYLAENKVEKAYRDAKITEIYEGTSEIQRLTILKQLIKSN